MSSCRKCGAPLAATAVFCSTCGTRVGQAETETLGQRLSDIFVHVPHPHIDRRKHYAPAKGADMHPRTGPLTRFNAFLAVKITDGVGTMWCAYAFAALAFISLPAAIDGGTAALIQWIAQTFLQLVLLSIIIVGQKVAGDASDKRAIDTYNDAEAVLHEALQIQQHLAAQDAVLTRLVGSLSRQA